MRITCPNCGAQYEVDDALIPESGRDVQCSSCGKGWFQSRQEAPAAPAPADVPPEAADEASAAPDTPADTDPGTGPSVWEDDEPAPAAARSRFDMDDDEFEAEEDPAPVRQATGASDLEPVADDDPAPQRMDSPPPTPDPEGEVEAEASREDGPEAPPTAALAAAPPRKTDEAILAVLREEAEREIAQRRQETATLESQPDLGLPETPGRSAGLKPVDAAEVGGTRQREILPDIDAINSSLRSDRDRGSTRDEETLVEEQRRGFRMGFGVMLLIAAGLVALYVGAAPLAEAVPALAPALAAYVDLANGLRTWIDGLLAAGVDGLSTLVPPPPGDV